MAEVRADVALDVLLDRGPLSHFLGRPQASGRFGWLLPPALRMLEFAVVIGATALVAPAAMPLAYAVLAVVVWHHYDAAYRLRYRQAIPPRWVAVAGGGWELRPLLVLVLAFGGDAVFTAALAVLLAWLGAVFVGESLVSWARHFRSLSSASAGQPGAPE